MGVALPQVPTTSPMCDHLRHHGKSYGCRLGGPCEPASVNILALNTCPKFKRGWRPGERQANLSGAKSSPCVYLGEPTRRRVECPPCTAKAGGAPKTFATFACSCKAASPSGECIPLNQGQRIEIAGYGCCERCPHKLVKPTVQVECRSKGIGDNLIAMGVAHGLGQQFGLPTATFAGPPFAKPWINLFDGFEVVSKPANSPTCYCDLADVEKVRASGIPRWKCWADKFGTAFKRPRMRPLPQAALDKAIPFAGRILLVPFAAHADRTWKLRNWIDLEALLLARGFRCVVLSSASETARGFQSPTVQGDTPANVAALMSFAVAVVGNDSGMAHLAGMIGRPTVAICSNTSDVDIFSCYPSVRQLGGRAVGGLNLVTPSQAANAATVAAHSELGDFPASEFAALILDQDKWRTDNWKAVYAALWRTVRELAPKRIVEIGTRAGYSAWTMLRACPDASVIGIDGNFAEHGGFVGAFEHAQAINKERFELRLADSHTLDRLPACDLLYVDGDHSEEGALMDLILGEKSGIRSMLVDDVTNCREVLAAVRVFLSSRPHWRSRFVPSDTGIHQLQRVDAVK